MNCLLWVGLAALVFFFWYACIRDEQFYIPQNTVVGGANVAYTADLEPPEDIPVVDYTNFHQLPAEDAAITSGMQ